MKQAWKKGLRLLFVLFLIWWLFGLLGAYLSTMKRPAKIPAPEQFFSEYTSAVQMEQLEWTTSDEQQIKAWYLKTPAAQQAVIILAGIGGNRTKMVDRAKLYLDRGYSVLLPDLRGTGASSGIISFGWWERLDLLGGFAVLKEKAYKKIGVHGCSLGAATICYSMQEQVQYDFVVLESPYDNILQALDNRLDRFYVPRLPRFMFWPLIKSTEWLLQVEVEKLAPEDFIAQLQVPTLLMAGSDEWKVKAEETRKLFAQCGAQDKKLHFFVGAYHEDFCSTRAEEYREVLGEWLGER